MHTPTYGHIKCKFLVGNVSNFLEVSYLWQCMNYWLYVPLYSMSHWYSRLFTGAGIPVTTCIYYQMKLIRGYACLVKTTWNSIFINLVDNISVIYLVGSVCFSICLFVCLLPVAGICQYVCNQGQLVIDQLLMKYMCI